MNNPHIQKIETKEEKFDADGQIRKWLFLKR